MADAEAVEIRTFESDAEALIAKAALDAFGIECELLGGHQYRYGTNRHGYQLVVRKRDAQKAEDVLNYRG